MLFVTVTNYYMKALLQFTVSNYLISNRKLFPFCLSSSFSSSVMNQASEASKGSERYAHRIIPHLLNLYGASATARDFDIYAPNATFEDPLMCAHGVKQIKSSFYSLSKVFSESRIVEYEVDEKIVSPGKHEILIDSKQYYKFLGRDVNMISLIVLHVEDGSVVRHEDRWNKKALKNRETIKFPLVGRILEVSRRGSMFATHAMMGFGKDPST